MGFYGTVIPGLLKVKVTRRRGRRVTAVGIGPRWLRYWARTDGSRGVSTGWGPFGAYRPIPRKRRRARRPE